MNFVQRWTAGTETGVTVRNRQKPEKTGALQPNRPVNSPLNRRKPELFNQNHPEIFRLNGKKLPGFSGSPVPVEPENRVPIPDFVFELLVLLWYAAFLAFLKRVLRKELKPKILKKIEKQI